MTVPNGSNGDAGQMKDILTTGLGMFIFGDVRFEPRNVVGVVIGLGGGILYSYFSYQDSQQRAKDTVGLGLITSEGPNPSHK